jgi:hypothetical protein
MEKSRLHEAETPVVKCNTGTCAAYGRCTRKAKVKFMEAYHQRRGQLQAPATSPPCPIGVWSGNQSPSGHFVKDNLLPLPVFELRLLCLATRSLVTILTELPQTHVFCLYSSLSVVNLTQTTPFAVTYLRQGFTRTLLLSATKDLNNALTGVYC